MSLKKKQKFTQERKKKFMREWSFKWLMSTHRIPSSQLIGRENFFWYIPLTVVHQGWKFLAQLFLLAKLLLRPSPPPPTLFFTFSHFVAYVLISSKKNVKSFGSFISLIFAPPRPFFFVLVYSPLRSIIKKWFLERKVRKIKKSHEASPSDSGRVVLMGVLAVKHPRSCCRGGGGGGGGTTQSPRDFLSRSLGRGSVGKGVAISAADWRPNANPHRELSLSPRSPPHPRSSRTQAGAWREGGGGEADGRGVNRFSWPLARSRGPRGLLLLSRWRSGVGTRRAHAPLSLRLRPTREPDSVRPRRSRQASLLLARRCGGEAVRGEGVNPSAAQWPSRHHPSNTFASRVVVGCAVAAHYLFYHRHWPSSASST